MEEEMPRKSKPFCVRVEKRTEAILDQIAEECYLHGRRGAIELLAKLAERLKYERRCSYSDFLLGSLDEGEGEEEEEVELPPQFVS